VLKHTQAPIGGKSAHGDDEVDDGNAATCGPASSLRGRHLFVASRRRLLSTPPCQRILARLLAIGARWQAAAVAVRFDADSQRCDPDHSWIENFRVLAIGEGLLRLA
jgi:hypothetical protein